MPISSLSFSQSNGVPMSIIDRAIQHGTDTLSEADVRAICRAKVVSTLCDAEGFNGFCAFQMSIGFVVCEDDYAYWVATKDEAIALWCSYQDDPIWKECLSSLGYSSNAEGVDCIALHHEVGFGGV